MVWTKPQQITPKEHIMKFQTNTTYTTRLATDEDSKISFTIVSRTEKTLKVKGDFMHDINETHTMRVKDFQGVETFRPWGSYSMCPVVMAN